MKQKQKTERRYPKIANMKQYVETLASRGDKVVYRYFGDAACKTVIDMTYGEFAEEIKNVAAAFETLGLAGKRVAILGVTCHEWVATYIATVAGNSVAIPMDKELSFDEILGFLEVSEANAVVYSKGFNQSFAQAVGNHPTVSHFIPMESENCEYLEKEGVIPFEKLVELGKENQNYQFPEHEDMDRMAEMLFTSGTTGTSKCVMLSERNILASMNAACQSVEFFPEDTIVSVLPIHHTYELCCMLAGMNYGMTVGINDSIKHALKSFATYRPTGLVLVPLFVETMYKKIWDEAKKKGKDKTLRFGLKLSRFLRRFGIDIRRKLFGDILAAFGGRLERIVCGGAPLKAEIVEKFEEFGVTIMEGYGITECSPLISVNPYFALKRGSVGPAVDCCTVKILDGEKGESGYEEGEICAKGDNVMLGYYKNPTETAKVFTEDGYFRTGDIGYLDKDGYIFITGRKKSVIVLENGKNVFPEEIEEYISDIEGVLESVAVGRTDEQGHVTLTVIVVPDPAFCAGKTQEEVEESIREGVRHMNKKLATFKQVKVVEFRKEPFEKTTSRKIKRHLVK